MTRINIAIALSAALACGCAIDPVGYTGGVSLEGRVGDREAPREGFLEYENYSDEYSSEIVLESHNGYDNAVMGAVYVEGIDLDELEPNTMIVAKNLSGVPEVTLYDDYGKQELDNWDVYVGGIGCSGESPEFYDLDVPAEKVVIKVRGRTGEREIEFENELEGGAGTVKGVVAVR